MINFSGAKILFDVRVPMRDGVTLSTLVFIPEADGQYPVILFRTPYNKNDDGIYSRCLDYARAGIVVVFMDVRGRGDSDGQFYPYRNDGIDGYDAVEWCAAQPWSNGNVGTAGGSYLGRIQWLTALTHPPHLKAMVVSVPPSDPFVEMPTGVPSPMSMCWHHYVHGKVVQSMAAVNWEKVYQHLPLLTMDEASGRIDKSWRDQFDHPQFDAFWDEISYQQKFDQMPKDLPVMHISGWYDDELIGTPLNYVGMVQHGHKNQKLLIGPWGHAVNTSSKMGEVEFGAHAIINLQQENISWFKRWLSPSEDSPRNEAPIRIFVMGTNIWRDEQEFPPAGTQYTPYYLHSAGKANSRLGDGVLSTLAPSVESGEPTDSYVYDPMRPFPFLTEPTSSQIGGADDYSGVELRGDVLVYTTPPLTEDIEVTGAVKVTLFASSTATDTDFMAKLLDVHPSGFVQRLCDGMVRARFRNGMTTSELITPNEIYQYEIDCWYTSQVFLKGHCIRLEIASSAFPKYDRNLNTGAPLGLTVDLISATQTIYHDADHPSCVILPIVPKG